jgi:hypothetical protein
VTEPDLSDDAEEPHEPQRKRRPRGVEADLQQVLRLMDLDHVPGEERAEEPDEEPPEARGADRARERPVDRGPRVVDDVVVGGPAAAGATGQAVGGEADVLGPPALEDQVQRQEQQDQRQREGPAR